MAQPPRDAPLVQVVDLVNRRMVTVRETQIPRCVAEKGHRGAAKIGVSDFESELQRFWREHGRPRDEENMGVGTAAVDGVHQLPGVVRPSEFHSVCGEALHRGCVNGPQDDFHIWLNAAEGDQCRYPWSFGAIGKRCIDDLRVCVAGVVRRLVLHDASRSVSSRPTQSSSASRPSATLQRGSYPSSARVSRGRMTRPGRRHCGMPQ